MEKLTLTQALEQGYVYYVYQGDGYQSLKHLTDLKLDPSDLERDDLELVEIDPQHPAGISSKDLAELIADHLEDQHSSETGCDTLDVYNTIRGLDFTDMEKKIAEELKGIAYHMACGIKLVKD